MAEEQPKQPRKVKDLKARLGRTIAPGVNPLAGGDGAIPPPGVGGDGPVPPPANIAPQGPVLGGPQVVAPPFLQKKKPKAAASDDPFAAGEEPAAGPREVRLVIDDSAVAESEVGRQSRRGVIMAASLSALVAIIFGFGVGNAMSGRRDHNRAVQSAIRIHEAVQSAEDPLNQIQAQLEKAMTAARGGAGKAPAVDYDAVQALQAVENPFPVDRFSTENYSKFNPAATDALFTFYRKSQDLFDQLRSFAARTRNRKTELDEAAAAANSLTTDQTGCIPVIANQRILCGLVYVDPPQAAAEGQAPSNMLTVRATKNGRPAEREIYTGQNIVENPDKYVILTNTATSVGVLGQRAAAFGEYSRDLASIKQTLDTIFEARGRLRAELDRIRSLDQLFVPFD
jgi:hypothetical protein